VDIGVRIKEVRKSLKMNQTDFGRRILLSQSQVGYVEQGKSVATERTIRLVCSEFGVDEKWLRTGEGEMLLKRNPSIADCVKQFSYQEMIDKLLSVYAELPSKKQEVVLEYTQRYISELMDAYEDPSMNESATPTEEDRTQESASS